MTEEERKIFIAARDIVSTMGDDGRYEDLQLIIEMESDTDVKIWNRPGDEQELVFEVINNHTHEFLEGRWQMHLEQIFEDFDDNVR